MTLSIVYNNIPFDDDLSCSWGMACVVRIFGDEASASAGGMGGAEDAVKTVLFDTGGNGEVLLSNMREMGIKPEEVDTVVLSHNHEDHTGGLHEFLMYNADVTVYAPSSFSRSFIRKVEKAGAEVIRVDHPVEIIPGVYSTGALGGYIKEQALVIESSAGPVLITGCSHPGIDAIALRAAELFEEDIYFITGGFHLGGTSQNKIRKIIQRLKDLGVQNIAPSHCTGDKAIRLFKEAWGVGFIRAGCGAVLEIP